MICNCLRTGDTQVTAQRIRLPVLGGHTEIDIRREWLTAYAKCSHEMHSGTGSKITDTKRSTYVDVR